MEILERPLHRNVFKNQKIVFKKIKLSKLEKWPRFFSVYIIRQCNINMQFLVRWIESSSVEVT